MGKRELLANVLESTHAGTLLSSTVAQWNGVVVFNYHRIGDASKSKFDRALFSATQEVFENQVRFLKQNFDVIGVNDLQQALHDPTSQSVLITFDDGYLDNYEVAFPVLQQLDATALFFITSGYLDDRALSWWDETAWMIRSTELQQLDWPEIFSDPLSLDDAPQIQSAIHKVLLKLKSLPEELVSDFLDTLGTVVGTGRCPHKDADKLWMSWDMVREMDQAGMGIGGHTVTHPVLANCGSERQLHEIETSKRRVEEELGHAITAFSYPVGQQDSFTYETQAILQEVGYLWGFSFYGGYCPAMRFEQFDLKRMPVEQRLDSNLFQSIARLPQIFARK